MKGAILCGLLAHKAFDDVVIRVKSPSNNQPLKHVSIRGCRRLLEIPVMPLIREQMVVGEASETIFIFVSFDGLDQRTDVLKVRSTPVRCREAYAQHSH